jgi:hypothetical protein
MLFPRPRSAPDRDFAGTAPSAALALLLLIAACGPARPVKIASGAPTEGSPGSPGPGFTLPDGGPVGPATAVPSVNPWSGQYLDPSLPPMAPGSFSGPGKETATAGPQIVYPLQRSLHAINVLDITIQWRRGDAAQTLFRLRFQNERGSYELYVPCALDECTYPVPADSWKYIAGLNRDRDVQLTVTGAGVAGGPDRVSAPVLLHFSPYRV